MSDFKGTPSTIVQCEMMYVLQRMDLVKVVGPEIKMAKYLSAVLFFLFFFVNNALSDSYAEKLKLFSEIHNEDKLMRYLAQGSYDELTLCQKHSQIYLNERSNLTGWAVRSNK